ncbi:MAG TPA: Ig-like domain-containing protein [Gemmatimonadaceae bacterium]|nr:Ig-like domain-containing protein [Gemmatimonadaceae bacterium]
MQKLTRSLFALGVLAGLAACGDDVSVTEPPPPTPAVTGISVTPDAATLAVGSTAQLSAVVTTNDPSVATTVTWASSNTAVATVSATGLVTAVTAGSATITATSTANANFRAAAQITVTPRDLGIRSVRVSPDNAIVTTGSTLQLVANVDANSGVSTAVTWASSNTAVATVSTAGVVTGVAAGTATITARSTVDTSKFGASAITVRNPVPPQISIATITTGTLNTPVNVNNVAGQIEVTLNVDPGDAVISRVEVLLDGNVACSQTFSTQRSQELSLSHVFENVQAAPVTCSINTAAFNATTGAVSYFNGARQLSARAITTTGTQVSTPSQTLTFNNVSGVVFTVSNNNGSDPATAVNPGQGLSWMGGSLTVNAVGVSYQQGVSITSVTIGNFGGGPFLGKTGSNVITLTPTTAGGSTGSITYNESGTWSATDTDLGGYLTAATITVPPAPLVLGEAPVAVATLLSNGQNGPANTLNFPAGALGNATLPIVPIVRIDNTSPGVASANGVAQAPITLGAAVIWVNASTSLAVAATTTNALGIPALSVLNASTTGTDVEEGVDAITVSVYTTPAAGALPATGGACNVTGLNLVTVGSQLTETTVSTAFAARIVFRDALGNQTCLDLATTFGADFTAPTATITGPAANTGYNAAPPAFAVTASDNASGFSATPLLVTMSRLNVTNTTTCVVGSGTGCTTPAQRPLTFSATDGSTTDGYYTTSVSIQDQAGNVTSLVTARLYGFDDEVPTFAGGISLPALIAGAATNTFTTSVADNLDLGSIFGDVAYPLATLRYPSQAIGSFGPPLEQAANNVNYAIANWIRCINAAGSFATASGQPTTITMTVTDQTTVAQNTASLTSGAFGANAQTCTGSVGNIAAADILSFTQSAPSYGTGKTQVDIDGASLATASSTSVTLSAIADVALNSSADPFTRVDFYYQNGGVWIKIGTATAVLAQTQTQRTYTYSFSWDPDAAVPVGAVTVQAIGVDAQGDAVLSGTQVVTTVP